MTFILGKGLKGNKNCQKHNSFRVLAPCKKQLPNRSQKKCTATSLKRLCLGKNVAQFKYLSCLGLNAVIVPQRPMPPNTHVHKTKTPNQDTTTAKENVHEFHAKSTLLVGWAFSQISISYDLLLDFNFSQASDQTAERLLPWTVQKPPSCNRSLSAVE